jgi:glutathione S-transferase
MPLTESPDCDLVLYTHPWSRGAIARWMVHETGADYRHVVLDFGTTMKTPEYLRVNPMGKVPTIEHAGNVVSECAAICAYLADAFPQAGLGPTSAGERARYYRWLFFAAGPVEAAVTNRAMKFEVPADKQGMVGYGSYERTVDVLAQAVAASPWLAGDRFTAADVYVGAQVMWGLQFGSLPKRPEFEAYGARLAQRPAYQAAKAIDEEVAQGLQKAKGAGS